MLELSNTPPSICFHPTFEDERHQEEPDEGKLDIKARGPGHQPTSEGPTLIKEHAAGGRSESSRGENVSVLKAKARFLIWWLTDIQEDPAEHCREPVSNIH